MLKTIPIWLASPLFGLGAAFVVMAPFFILGPREPSWVAYGAALVITVLTGGWTATRYETKLVDRTEDTWTYVTLRKRPRTRAARELTNTFDRPAAPVAPSEPQPQRKGIAPWWIVLGAVAWVFVASVLSKLPGSAGGWGVGLLFVVTVLALVARWGSRRGERKSQAATDRAVAPAPAVASAEILEKRTPAPFPAPFPARPEQEATLDVQREILAELRKMNEPS